MSLGNTETLNNYNSIEALNFFFQILSNETEAIFASCGFLNLFDKWKKKKIQTQRSM